MNSGFSGWISQFCECMLPSDNDFEAALLTGVNLLWLGLKDQAVFSTWTSKKACIQEQSEKTFEFGLFVPQVFCTLVFTFIKDFKCLVFMASHSFKCTGVNLTLWLLFTEDSLTTQHCFFVLKVSADGFQYVPQERTLKINSVVKTNTSVLGLKNYIYVCSLVTIYSSVCVLMHWKI